VEQGCFIHPTAEVSPDAVIGPGTSLWNQVQVRAGVSIGAACIIGKNAYIDANVLIGSRVKIQNNASIFHGVTIEDGVFIGPHVCFTNDVQPRAITPQGHLKGQEDWVVGTTLVRSGASVGAGSVILSNLTIGRFAMIGAGSVVTRSVPDYGLVYGNPARQHGYVCRCGQRLGDVEQQSDALVGYCAACHLCITLLEYTAAASQAR
jgi:UDP-2-acetamido-3-amino-2,3-dideoxy-glucuronate N-acetyltransferase